MDDHDGVKTSKFRISKTKRREWRDSLQRRAFCFANQRIIITLSVCLTLVATLTRLCDARISLSKRSDGTTISFEFPAKLNASISNNLVTTAQGQVGETNIRTNNLTEATSVDTNRTKCTISSRNRSNAMQQTVKSFSNHFLATTLDSDFPGRALPQLLVSREGMVEDDIQTVVPKTTTSDATYRTELTESKQNRRDCLRTSTAI